MPCKGKPLNPKNQPTPRPRPTLKAVKMKRTKEIRIRVNEEEYSQLVERKEGKELATWIRKICLEQKISKPYRKCDPELLRAIGRVGGNMNQIAKQVNTLDKDTDKLRIFAQLAVIREQLNEVLNNHDS